MGAILKQLKMIFDNPSPQIIREKFEDQSYIRLNMIHISPVTLKHFKEKLISLGMTSWCISDKGIEFFFPNYKIEFKGNLSVSLVSPKNERLSNSKKTPQEQREEEVSENDNNFPKIYCIELDFEPVVTPPMPLILSEIETYLKSADSIFFMSYIINTDQEILTNDLSKSIDLITRRIEKKNEFNG